MNNIMLLSETILKVVKDVMLTKKLGKVNFYQFIKYFWKGWEKGYWMIIVYTF